jgi:hypothetical protein
MLKTILVTITCATLLAVPAEAKHKHHRRHATGNISSVSGVHFVRGRLICAINVNNWLRAHGFSPTHSAAAKSFLRYLHVSPSQVRFGDVRFNYRKGGGHVMVALGGGRCLNPSARRQTWVVKACPVGGVYVRAS